MTMTVWEIPIKYFKGSPSWNLMFFSCHIFLMGFEEEDHRYEVPFSSHQIKGYILSTISYKNNFLLSYGKIRKYILKKQKKIKSSHNLTSTPMNKITSYILVCKLHIICFVCFWKIKIILKILSIMCLLVHFEIFTCQYILYIFTNGYEWTIVSNNFIIVVSKFYYK